MAELVLKLAETQVDTTRTALKQYYATLDKLSKKEMESNISAEGTLARMGEIEEIIRVMEPQTDMFSAPPESWEIETDRSAE